MTKKIDITGMWAGQTVAILGAGPDMTAELAETARGYKTIAVNRAVKFAPWADAFVALDPHHPFWQEAEALGFKGLRFLGVEREDYDAIYIGMLYERVKIDEHKTLEIRNNALAAIRVAQKAGAAKIILIGFDPDRYEEVHKRTGFSGLTEGLEQITAELRAAGVIVERIDSSLKKPVTRALRRGELKQLELDKQKAQAEIDLKTFPETKPKKKQVHVPPRAIPTRKKTE